MKTIFTAALIAVAAAGESDAAAGAELENGSGCGYYGGYGYRRYYRPYYRSYYGGYGGYGFRRGCGWW